MSTDLGDPWPDLSVDVLNVAGDLANATEVRLTISDPAGVPVITAELVAPVATGVYARSAAFVPDQLGWWRADWLATGENATAHTQWLYVVPATPWVTSPEQVHAQIAVRPAFTDTSRPTRAQVQELVDQAVEALRGEVGETLPVRLYGKARLVVTLHAAAMVESTFFPEQQLGDSGQYDRLYQRYKDELLGLRSMLGDRDGSGAGSAFTAHSPVAQAVARLYPGLYA